MRKSKILKGISYTLIPILLLIIIVAAFYEIGKDSFDNSPENDLNYFETDSFLYSYMNTLSNKTFDLIYNNDKFNKIQDGEKKICYINNYYSTYDYYNNSYIKDFYFLIEYKDLLLTNVELTEETNTIDEIRNYINSQDGKKANIVDGKVEANSEIISNKALQYFDYFDYKYYSIKKPEISEIIAEDNNTSSDIEEATTQSSIDGELITEATDNNNIPQERIKEYHQASISDFKIYTTYKEELELGTDQIMAERIINIIAPYEKTILYALPISSVILVILVIYLIISIGHSKDKDEIDLNDFDKMPFEIICLICLIVFGICISIPIAYLQYSNSKTDLFISLFIASYFITYISVMLPLVTTIKRLKAKMFWKTTITGKIFNWFIKTCKRFIKAIKGKYNNVTKSWNKTFKLLIILLGYALVSLLLMGIFQILGLLIAIGIGCYLVYKFNEKVNCYEEIEKHLKEMYEGDHSKKLNYQDFTPEFQDIVKYINDVSSGFENAIQEGIKSERLKTELITNVSHDIKTPLTSIINYVDLLKKEDIQNEKEREYIDVLDNKSQRLKKLTEDLVEASKASSGNVKLNIEKINIIELVKQTTGEFEDKFKEKNLDIITTVPEEVIYINADNRYMYRIIENLFSNISKYALENSRVYIDVNKQGNKVKIYIKNISKEKLNISADELMQRFVRGDKSRTTEGSGLGISISKSLTEIQKGKFNLQVDGDLFKVELEFDII